MNIQLFLEGQEVELTNDIVFPLNKTFENLSNPTDIIVEYSKTVNIPMTKVNNEIMGHAYSINRTIPVSAGQPNIGLYFDPNKRIPFRLIYNGTLLMEGYAKFTSANYSTTNKYYSLNLYGALGDIFHKLKEVPVEEIDDHCDDYENNYFNSSFAWTSFNIDDPTASLTEAHPYEIFGLAPAYRGLYPNFKSDQKYSTVAQEGSTEGFKSFAVELRDKWKEVYAQQKYSNAYIFLTDAQKQAVDTYIDGLDPEGAIGSGLADNQVHEYRSYHLRPYIWFNKLMQMYQEKCAEITDYTIELDPYWFSPSNPYWTRSCYMLDYLTSDGVETNAKQQIANYKTTYYTSRSGNNKGSLNTYLGYFRTGGSATRFDMAAFTLNFHHQLNYTAQTSQDVGRITAIGRKLSSIELRYNTYSRYIITIYAYPLDSNGNYNSGNYHTCTYWAAADPFNASDSTYSPTNNTPLTYTSTYEMGTAQSGYYTAVSAKLDASCSVPASTFYDDYSHGAYLRVSVQCNNEKEDYFTSYYIPSSVNPLGAGRLPAVNAGRAIVLGSSSDYNITSPTYYVSNNVSSLPVALKNVWKKETTPFDVILEYTKMFGLVWSIDYAAKTIHVTPRGRYFQNYTIESWDDKLDKSKDFIVEPVVFPSKYIEFNYEDVDGFRYKQYQDKYNMPYGGLKVKTNYDFNTEAEPLFEGINPSISSNRNIIHYTQLYNWDLSSVIRGVADPIERMECADVDDGKELNINNWYLRCENVFTSDMNFNSYVTDDNAYMIEHDNYCYYDMVWKNPTDPISQLQALPQFSAVYKEDFMTGLPYYGILFNQPNEDYTTKKVYTEANNQYIYNLFWDKYISERYNIQNKKLTAYFRLHPSDYFDFKFNKFVTLDNQLFCINKIFDYNVQSNEPTKVELIQITNPDHYADTDACFDPLQLSTDHYSLNTSNSGGTFSFFVRTNDRFNTNISIPSLSPNNMYVEDVETYSYGWVAYALTWEIPSSGGSIETTVTITNGNYSKEFQVNIYRS